MLLPKDRATKKQQPMPNEEKPMGGVGTELKRILRRFGIADNGTCGCNTKAAIMDTLGIEWCEQHIEKIVGWLREAAEKRGLPFFNPIGKALVKQAIRATKKKQSIG